MVPETPLPQTPTKEAPGPKADPLTRPLENIPPTEMALLKQTAHAILNTLETAFSNPGVAADIQRLNPVRKKQVQDSLGVHIVDERKPISEADWPEIKAATKRLSGYAASSKPTMELFHFALIQAAQGNDIPRTPNGGFDLEALSQQFAGQELPKLNDPNPQASTSTPAGIERLVAHTIDKFLISDLDPIEEFARPISKASGYNPILNPSLDYIYSGTKAVQSNLGLIKRALGLVLEEKQIPISGYHGVIDLPAMKKVLANDSSSRDTFPTVQSQMQQLPALVSTN